MEHQTPSGFPGNFRKLKVLGTLWFPSGLPETLVKVLIAKNLNKKISLSRKGQLRPSAHTHKGQGPRLGALGTRLAVFAMLQLRKSLPQRLQRRDMWLVCIL